MFCIDEFMRNFFSSPTVRAHLPFMASMPRVVEKVEYQKLATNAINMEFFDVLINEEITMDNGYIMKEMEEHVNGV